MDSPTIHEIYNYREVDSSLSTAGQPAEDELRALAAGGFEVVINLALHNDPRYSLPDEAGLAKYLGLAYVHIPVLFTAPTEQDLLDFFAAMEAHQGRRMLVHCAANKRVTAFLGLYRIIRQHWPEPRAFELMHELWEPDAVWTPFIASMLTKHRSASRGPATD